MCGLCVRGDQDTLLELLCDAVAAAVRQGKGIVISGFPGDLRHVQAYEAKVRAPDRRGQTDRPNPNLPLTDSHNLRRAHANSVGVQGCPIVKSLSV